MAFWLKCTRVCSLALLVAFSVPAWAALIKDAPLTRVILNPAKPRFGDAIRAAIHVEAFRSPSKVATLVVPTIDNETQPLTTVHPTEHLFVALLGSALSVGVHDLKLEIFIEDKDQAQQLRNNISRLGNEIARLQEKIARETDPTKKAQFEAELAQKQAQKAQAEQALLELRKSIGVDHFAFTVAPNVAPQASDETRVRPVNGAAVTINVLENDSDTEADAIKVVSVTQPSRGSVVANANGTVTYTPDDSKVFKTQRVSMGQNGQEPNGVTGGGLITGDNRYVVFNSNSTNLISEPVTGFKAYRADLKTNEVTLISRGPEGAISNGSAPISSVSFDGRFVVMEGDATNMILGDVNGLPDIFLRDLTTGKNTLVSVAADGSQSDGESFNSWISANGKFVVFVSAANNLTDQPDNNGTLDVFVRDLEAGQTKRVSVASDGTESNGESQDIFISDNGRYVTFGSLADNLAAEDFNGAFDVFRHDTVTGETRRVSVSSTGVEANGASYSTMSSGDGRMIYFFSDADNLVANDFNGQTDAFVHDTQTGETTRLSLASDGLELDAPAQSYWATSDAKYLLLGTAASNAIPEPSNGLTQCYFKDRTTTSQMIRVSVGFDGALADNHCLSTAPSHDGQYILLRTRASNIGPSPDTNTLPDLYMMSKTDSFTYTISDGRGGHSTATVTLTEPFLSTATAQKTASQLY